MILDLAAQNQYLYDGVSVDRSSSTGRDADGRICAVASTSNSGMTIMTGYLYNGSGIRVAKGSITAWSCDPALSGFQTTDDYILGLAGEQVTEMGVGGATTGATTSGLVWEHTNVWAAGKLLATYDGGAVNGAVTSAGLHFYLVDPLGTRRVQTDYAGNIENTCFSLPFGDGETCGTTPTEHLFTGKERDTESELDYFGARYYSSTMGRFMSPDWSAKFEPVPYAKLDDPQTLNLYSYVQNNPLFSIDPDGHWDCASGGKDAGSLACGVQNQWNSVHGITPTAQQQSSGNAAIKPTTFTYNALVPLSPFVQYTTESDRVNAVFSPETATHLNAAFSELNKDGIVPQITSAFRTDADQTRMQNGGSGSNPAARFSWHQAGGAVDIGGTHSRQFPTIISVMKSNGFVWGGDFHGRTDPPHFDGRNFLNYQWGRILDSQGYWNATQ